jgi:hypothetical protein
MGFNIPKDGEIFTDNILERCQDLISTGIWNGITGSQLRIWLNNFVTDEEKYFSACILDKLIYRSNQHTVAMMEHSLQRVLPDLARTYNLFFEREDCWINELRKHPKSNQSDIRLVPVIRSFDSPSKSAPLIARMYRHYMNVNESWIIWPEDINNACRKGIDTFVFIDDFLGTGTQFTRFAHYYDIQNKLNDRCAIYAPFVAHQAGIDKLNKELPWLKACSVELLNEAYSLFHGKDNLFSDDYNDREDAFIFYLDLISSRMPELHKNDQFGFGGLSLTYVFEHATSNNCIPLLWYNSGNWKSLFQR